MATAPGYKRTDMADRSCYALQVQRFEDARGGRREMSKSKLGGRPNCNWTASSLLSGDNQHPIRPLRSFTRGHVQVRSWEWAMSRGRFPTRVPKVNFASARSPWPRAPTRPAIGSARSTWLGYPLRGEPVSLPTRCGFRPATRPPSAVRPSSHTRLCFDSVESPRPQELCKT